MSAAYVITVVKRRH